MKTNNIQKFFNRVKSILKNINNSMNDNLQIWKLYNIIFEEFMGFSKDVFYGWISPEGKLYPNRHRDSHYDTLKKIMTEINYQGNAETDEQSYEQLYELGYCRLVHVYLNIVYLNNSIKPPTQRQVKIVKDLCIERGMNVLYYDNDKKERRLWIR